MTKREPLKSKKICPACGEEFFGTAGKITCSGRCRSIVARLKAAQKRPEFLLMAKGKGQKIPDLNAPKRLLFKKGEKKPKPEFLDSKVVYTVPDEKAFDGKELKGYTLDEPGQFEIPKELTKEEKFTKRMELEKELKKVEGRNHGFGDGHPKMFALEKAAKISKIKEEIEKLK